MQQALESALEPARRRSVHRRLALGAAAAAAGALPARVAAHHEAGGDPARAIPWRQRAFDGAMKLLALDDALAHGQQALVDGADGDLALAQSQGNLRVLELLGRDDKAMADADALLQRPGGSPAARAEARIAVATYLAFRDLAPRALALLDELPQGLDAALRDAHLAAAEVWVMLTEAALTLGDTAATRQTWQHALSPHLIEVETVRQRHALVAVMMQLVDGHAADALTGLPPPDAPGLSPELRAAFVARWRNAPATPTP